MESRILRELSQVERKTYDYIKEVDENQTTNLTKKRMWVTIPNLENLGLVQVFKKYTIRYFGSRKKKFVKKVN
jgi:hypothetical protein